MSLFVRKPMDVLLNEAAETGSHTLKRTLGRYHWSLWELEQ